VFDPPRGTGLHKFPFNVAISLLLAASSYKWIERPFLRLKDGITQESVGNIGLAPWLEKATSIFRRPQTYAR